MADESFEQETDKFGNEKETPTLEMIYKILMNVQGNIQEIMEDNKIIKKEHEDLKKVLDFQSGTIDKLTQENNRLNSMAIEHEKLLKQCKDEAKVLRSEMYELEERQDDMNQYQRKHNLEIHGIPEEKDEDLEVIIKDIGEALDVEIEYDKIDIVHRIPSKQEIRPIIVKFLAYSDKKELYEARRKLRMLKDPLIGVQEVQRVMSRNRYEKIRQYLHLNDQETMIPRGQPNHDKLHKVRPVIETVSRTFQEEYDPSKYASIDEGMIKYKGRLGFKQYMPMKPVKRGIKVWVRADAENGFVSEFRVYTGKQDGGPEHGLGYKVIHELTRPLVGKNYHIICDNFFTTVGLAEDLLKDKLYLCGTTRANRKEFPKDLKDKERVKKLRRGEAIIRQKGNIVATIWKDKKPVAFLSTQCKATGDVTVLRKQKDGSVIEVPSLPVVKLYNKYMGGVDKADQLRQYYSVARRANKWWRLLLCLESHRVPGQRVVRTAVTSGVTYRRRTKDRHGF
ncbi:hypothetical protein QZH41_006223 [Actinostola sp. cb2023]|nr:hypothetical protein QZH41_006223 [Actinostola sp. cb2023]